MKLVVGLGNPGRKYQDTRHNLGYLVAAQLARKYATGNLKIRFQGETVEATLEGARLRLRPIIMTSLAFGFGILPLVLASGAGAGAQKAIGTGALGGVVTATFLVTLFAPLFYVLVEKTFGKSRKGKRARTDEAAGADPSGNK